MSWHVVPRKNRGCTFLGRYGEHRQSLSLSSQGVWVPVRDHARQPLAIFQATPIPHQALTAYTHNQPSYGFVSPTVIVEHKTASVFSTSYLPPTTA